jgi:hypothetical protein
VNHLARPGYEFYRDRYGLTPVPMTTALIEPPYENVEPLANELAATHGRVWVLLADVHPSGKLGEFVNALLHSRGRALEDHRRPLTRLTLYDFAAAPSAATTNAATTPAAD